MSTITSLYPTSFSTCYLLLLSNLMNLNLLYVDSILHLGWKKMLRTLLKVIIIYIILTFLIIDILTIPPNLLLYKTFFPLE